jgi:hypothetical protein
MCVRERERVGVDDAAVVAATDAVVVHIAVMPGVGVAAIYCVAEM